VNPQAVVLASRIEMELTELRRVSGRTLQAWDKAIKQHDDYYLDSVALNLHAFYSGLERIFEKLASSIDGSVPGGANRHQELLAQMQTEIPAIRPAVISSELKELLEEYRGFRHVVRNVYSYHLKPEKLKHLVEKLETTFAMVSNELADFARFLSSLSE
jgi:DNA-binding HxlR family transcriptional regulator